MRSLVVALALGAAALGVTAAPTQASAAHPVPACNAPRPVAPCRVYRPAHYHRHYRAHYRSYRPVVPVYSVPACPVAPACVPVPPCH